MENYYYNGQGPNSFGIQPHSIATCIILTFVTCGIYGICWMIRLNDEINLLAGEPDATSGGMVFVLSLVTCGIYAFYWAFKMGEKVDRIKGNPCGSTNILFLVLCFVGVGTIVNYCIMQDTINHIVE